ncbi:hypothetical protein B0H15DRAFT_13023 [Mycena belliarum]|uniref:Uncharacterized protein n=1 Tax=Mycena belliarum TaxID=1033014 RepID=A0AAD6UKI2_9AGAR|nr:hypothetical protein B0H15DRAFT_13023 [Mycena belliae]
MLPRPYHIRNVCRRILDRRSYAPLLALLLLVLASGFLFSNRRPDELPPLPVLSAESESPASVLRSPGPPTYAKLWAWEQALPQHSLDMPYPEGKEGRYVRYSNMARRLGFNNILNEVLMNTHLSYMSKRAFVFPTYHWALNHYQWPPSQRLEEQPKTPLNAFISGPSAGGLWGEGDNAPRSVSEAWYEVVCPESERRIINTTDVKPQIGAAEGDKIFATWQKLLSEAPERCIDVVPALYEADNFPQVFDLWLWGSPRILSLWDSFSKSPTSTLLQTSPIVEAAVNRNRYLFHPRGPRPPHPAPHDPYKRMLAMHVRRGDYQQACEALADFGSTFYGWNMLPFLPDVFTPLPHGHPDRVERAMEHCSPSLDAILTKVHVARAEYLRASQTKTLDVLYILTNERDEWLEELLAALRKENWGTLVTSHELELDAEQIDVSGAVDMDIARRAAVFIGNGWSSFTSNIVHRRLVEGKIPLSIRFY